MSRSYGTISPCNVGGSSWEQRVSFSPAFGCQLQIYEGGKFDVKFLWVQLSKEEKTRWRRREEFCRGRLSRGITGLVVRKD